MTTEQPNNSEPSIPIHKTQEFKDLVHKEASQWSREKISELESKPDLSESEKGFLEFLKKNDIEIVLRNTFFELISVIEYYMDDTPENIIFYSLWLIGTYFHKQFYSYPYLFLNAMRGSGKSRLLKLLSVLGNGRYTSSLTESIVFRTQGLLCVDEMEGIGGKDKSTLRELLNASYKKGMTIMRTVKKKDITGDSMKIEEFEPYRPIAMANIWGMDEVLGDRCITRILEKSNDDLKTIRVEDFSEHFLVQNIKVKLVQCSYCSVELQKKIQLWNKYIDTIHNYTQYNNYTNYPNYIFSDKEKVFYDKILATKIQGRNLELFLPILVIADMVGEDIFDTTLCIVKKLNDEKKETELQESSDVLLYKFISLRESNINYVSVKELFNEFREYSQIDGEWFNDKWFGKALKRLNLIIQKRRVSRGIEVILNTVKAREKMKIFESCLCPTDVK